MASNDLSGMFDEISKMTEVLGGMRKQLISQGFSSEIAEQIIVESLRNQNASSS